MYDVIIIGGGPAGLTAAIYARRAGYTTLVLEQLTLGGQAAVTTEVENYPGIATITGADFAQNLHEQALALGADIRLEQVTEVDLKDKVKTVVTSINVHEGKTVIVANGAIRRKLEVEGEQRLTGRGVSYCATCDGAFFRGKEVAIVGGGNTALEDALFLAQNCKTVYLVHRRGEFRGGKILLDAVEKKENIIKKLNTTVKEIVGENVVQSVVLQSAATGEIQTLPVQGVFVAVGLIADNQIFATQLELDDQGYIKSTESCTTSLEGVYVAGDTRTKELRQIVTAASDGAVAATAAANYLGQQSI